MKICYKFTPNTFISQLPVTSIAIHEFLQALKSENITDASETLYQQKV